jgi:lysylphosphatidylglycerol synthetase-like protein (DUF2156 family)
MKALYRWMIALHILIGAGASAGGLGAVMSPTSPMGMSTDALENGPFKDFLVPGLFLLCVLGLGNLAAALGMAKKASLHGIASGFMGATMLAWIVIQCIIIESVVLLHAIFFFLGALQGILAIVLLYRRNEFPLSIVRYWLGTED